MNTIEFVCLAFHEIQAAGRHPFRSNPGYKRYVLLESTFREHLGVLRQLGYEGCTVTEALQRSTNRTAITVDDCNSSDIDTTARVLQELGFHATFYAVGSWINTARHISSHDLQHLVSMGMEVGSHSWTHSFLPRMSHQEMRRELAQSKDFLEQVAGVPVKHFSCPFGGYNRALLDTALEAGYSTVATSHIGRNKPPTVVLNRVVVHRDTSSSDFGRIFDRRGLFGREIRQAILSPLKWIPRFQGYSR